MDAKIDYISFTLPIDLSGVGHGEEAYGYIQSLAEVGGYLGLLDFFGGREGTARQGRGHYGAGLYFEGLHASVWFGGVANHVLVELAGAACQTLRDLALEHQLIAEVVGRLTRLDIAVDFLEEGFPSQWVACGYNERFKSRSTIESGEGWTEYVGSPKSARFARVYLYREPHPRSGVLRVEHVLRSDYAKAAGELYVQQGMEALVSSVGKAFGWKDPRWKPSTMSVSALRAKRHDTAGAGSIFWLENQVKPALRRMAREGLIDLEQWLLSVFEGDA